LSSSKDKKYSNDIDSKVVVDDNDEDESKATSPLYVIDKQLSNTWWAGALPPCSKTIVLRRDHMDLGFSNFKTNFPVGGYEYTYNQTELAWRVALTNRLITLWEKIIPSENLLSISYEDIVNDTENTMKKISKFLNLKYNLKTTTPHLTKGIITSHTSYNIRLRIEKQKLNSIKHWENYAFLLEEYIYAYDDAIKWIQYVMDGKGVMSGEDASPQGWLQRGAHFDELASASSSSSSPTTSSEKEDKLDDLPLPTSDEL
jgi:hypothetical protein